MSEIEEAMWNLKNSMNALDYNQRAELESKISSFIKGIAEYPKAYLSTPVATKPGAPSGSAIKCPKCGDDLKVYLTR